jgi:integral membrane protein (TIGR00529 family)
MKEVELMRELAAVIISFLIIPILSKKKISIGIAICTSAIFMAFLGGLGIRDLLNVFIDTFFNFNKLQQFIIIIEISVLGVLLRRYEIINKIIEYLTKLVRSNRMTLMFIPALIGFLSVPGGAIISAPFVDKLGEEADLTKSNRAIINLVYRHIAMHIMPYSPGFLLVASLAPQISVYKMIGLNLTFVIPYVISGYYLYVRQVKNEPGPPLTDVLPNLLNLLKYTAPVYVSVLLNLIFCIPFYIGMLANLLIVYLINPNKSFFSDAVRAININVLYSLIGVYLIQGIVGQMESLTSFFTYIFSNPGTILLGIIGSSFFLGLTTGFQATSLGVVLPLLVSLPISANRLLLYGHMTFAWGFVGYFFSPLHLCQLFTCEYLKVPIQDLYKDYYKFFISLVAILLSTYFVLGIWLK